MEESLFSTVVGVTSLPDRFPEVQQKVRLFLVQFFNIYFVKRPTFSDI